MYDNGIDWPFDDESSLFIFSQPFSNYEERMKRISRCARENFHILNK